MSLKKEDNTAINYPHTIYKRSTFNATKMTKYLQDDGDVGGVEQLDLVRAGLATDAVVLDLQLHTESLS